MKPLKSRHAVAWLRTEPGFARLGEQASRLASLQQDLTRCMPLLALTVVALERDTLVVGAAHAAVAARVRQLEPTLVAALGRCGWKIDRIRFKPQWRPVAAPPPRTPKASPGPDAIADISALSERIEDPRLKAALRRLATRHGGRPG
jgi:hypothetical protein